MSKNRVDLIIKNTHLLGLLDFVHAGLIRQHIEQAQAERYGKQQAKGESGVAAATVDVFFFIIAALLIEKEINAKDDDIGKDQQIIRVHQ
ncbi:hypothetical protein D3C76_1378800 [compost metagenome]